MKWSTQCLVALSLLATVSLATATPIARYQRFTGNYNYVATGGTLRNSDVNTCALNATSSQALSGIPAGATVAAAYLYWGGSGATVDSVVSLNGNTVSAGRTFTTTFSNGGTNYPFFGGFADVTSLISGNATLTFGGLSVDSGNPFCAVSAVVSGWSLIVIYQSSAEPLRAINIFDGLDYFRGSAVTEFPDGFRIPATGIDGKMTVVTWEGDPGNSDPLNGFSESLSFNGALLDDGIVPAGSVPTVQQYDGTINTLGLDNTYGVDVDTYNISSYLSAGQTTATTNYSAGGDLVLLTAQIVSVTSEPQIDLSIAKTHVGNFAVNSNASYTLHIANEPGVQSVDYPTTVSDTLPAGLSYVSATGTGWSCSAVGQVVSCTHPAPLAAGSAFPNISLTVAVGNAAYPSVSNTATVSSAGSNDNITGNNASTDAATVLGTDLSTSAKTVVDQNGGEANAGDTLRYTINVINSTAVAATGVSVTDNVPGNVSGFSVISIPGGSTNSSTGAGTGTNNTGFLNITGISVPANGSVSIVFDVVVAAGTSAGATIDNTAAIANPTGPGASPAAPQVVVSPSQVAGTGTKQLYVWSNPGNTLSRTRPTGVHNAVTINGASASAGWTITPALQKAVTLQAGNFAVRLLLARTGSSTGSSRTVSVALSNSVTGAIGAPVSNTVPSTTATLVSFNLNLPASASYPAGSTFTLTVTNTTSQSNRSVSVTPYSGASYSLVELNSATIINVDTVQTYNAAYAGGVVTGSFTRGATAYVRAVVSDPFGSFDVSGAAITLRNPSGTDVVTSVAMTQVNDSGAATKTYEYAFVIPPAAPAGVWSARVVANEGAEGTITDLGVGTFTVSVALPSLLVTKTSQPVFDPINGISNPKRIPGSIVSYVVTVTNSGTGTVDASSLIITDVVPANTSLCVSNINQCTTAQFSDGTPTSGLSFNSGGSSYSNAVGGNLPFTYAPVANTDGVDPLVTGLRLAPLGSMAGSSGGGSPSFSISFKVKVN